jgi:O-antigen/teichoic acid export membrane protein
MIYSHGFRAEQQVGALSLLETTDRVVTAGLVALIVLFHFSLLWTYILIIYSDLPFFFILVMMARRRFGMRVRFSLIRVREHLLASLPLMGYNALTLIAAQADLLILMALAGPLSVGVYALAGRITNPLFSVALAFVIGLYPLLCRKFEEGHEQFAMVYQEAMRVLALCIIALAIFVSAEANIIVTLLGGQHFAAAAIAVQLLMWAMVVVFFSQLAVRTCMAANIERLIPYVTAASAAVNILANLVLIPHWQIVGAGVAALLSELVGLCLFTVLLRRHVRLLSTMNMLLRVLLANLPALAFLLWQQHASLLLTAPIALVLTIIGYFATRTLSPKDIHMGMRILYTWRGRGTQKI